MRVKQPNNHSPTPRGKNTSPAFRCYRHGLAIRDGLCIPRLWPIALVVALVYLVILITRVIVLVTLVMSIIAMVSTVSTMLVVSMMALLVVPMVASLVAIVVSTLVIVIVIVAITTMATMAVVLPSIATHKAAPVFSTNTKKAWKGRKHLELGLGDNFDLYKKENLKSRRFSEAKLPRH